MRAWLAALLLMAVGMGPARADCATPEIVTARVEVDVPGLAPVRIDGPAADRLGAQIAAYVQEDLPEGGVYMVFTDPTLPRTYIVLFIDGCAFRHGFFPTALAQEWIGGRAS